MYLNTPIILNNFVHHAPFPVWTSSCIYMDPLAISPPIKTSELNFSSPADWPLPPGNTNIHSNYFYWPRANTTLSSQNLKQLFFFISAETSTTTTDLRAFNSLSQSIIKVAHLTYQSSLHRNFNYHTLQNTILFQAYHRWKHQVTITTTAYFISKPNIILASLADS